jgi:hypothetical protein
MQSGECSDNNHKNKELESEGHHIQVSTHSREKRTGDTECAEEEANCMPSCVSSDYVKPNKSSPKRSTKRISKTI